MPLYDWSGTKHGSPHEGQVLAETVNEALKLLSQEGAKVSKIQPSSYQPQQPVQAQAQVRQPVRQPLNLSPMADPLASPHSALNQPVQQRIGAPSRQSMDSKVVRTRPAKDAERSIYFAQLADMARGGIALPTALEFLADRVRRSPFEEPSRIMAAETAEGRPMADSMARFPDLFLPCHVGGVRAGEMGGYLPDAFQALADQSREMGNFNRKFWWAWVGFLNTFLVFLIFTMLRGVVTRGIDWINGKNDGSNVFGIGLWQSLTGPWGILFIILSGILIYISWAKNQTFTRPLRHKLGATFPILKKRAAGEALSVFTWNLSKLAKAGLSPHRTWGLASDTVPNMHIAKSLEIKGNAMGDSSKLSDLYASVPGISWEVSSIVQTGEMTGRIAEALEQASSIEMVKAKEAEKNFTWRMGCWVALLVIGGGLLGFMVLYGTYLQGALTILDQEEDSAPSVTAPQPSNTPPNSQAAPPQ